MVKVRENGGLFIFILFLRLCWLVIFVFDMVINFKFLFYVEIFIIIILVKWDNLSNYVIFRVL